MSENKKNYVIIKTAPHDVLFLLHPISNIALTREVHLTDRVRKYALPLDWALGVFQDPYIFNMYRKGYFTFDDNKSIVEEAYKAGVYFGEALDFAPAKENKMEEILKVLKSGNRKAILDLAKAERDVVIGVAQQNIDVLPQGVVNMLENTLGVQLIVDVK